MKKSDIVAGRRYRLRNNGGVVLVEAVDFEESLVLAPMTGKTVPGPTRIVYRVLAESSGQRFVVKSAGHFAAASE